MDKMFTRKKKHVYSFCENKQKTDKQNAGIAATLFFVDGQNVYAKNKLAYTGGNVFHAEKPSQIFSPSKSAQ